MSMPSETIQACSDPRDDRILEAAVAGGAKLILKRRQSSVGSEPVSGRCDFDGR